MSILINLLPDIRQAKLRERRRRQLVSGVAVTIWAVCGGVLVIMFVYLTGLKVDITSLTGKIVSQENQLQNVSGLTDALTAEQHVASLSSLYGQRVYMTKFFQAYQAASPTDVSISSLSVDAGNNLAVSGTAPSYAEVAKIARALADSNVLVGPDASASNAPYFSDVNIGSVSSGSSGLTFSISATIGSGALSGN